MDCRELLAILSDYLDEELDPGICDEIEVHLEECQGSCARFVETFKITIELYRSSLSENVPQEVRLCLHHLLWQRWIEEDI